jgi:hypothetical protein
MYLTVSSWFLISFVMGGRGGGPSRAIKFLYAPAPPSPTVWALKPPLWALVHKTTYASMIYTALCILGLNDTRISAQCHFTGPKKFSISRPPPPPPPLALVLDMPASKTLCKGCINHRCTISYFPPKSLPVELVMSAAKYEKWFLHKISPILPKFLTSAVNNDCWLVIICHTLGSSQPVADIL